MTFERFLFTKGRQVGVKVSVRKSGHISFNKAAVEKFKVDTFSLYALGYDKKKNAIAVYLTSETSESDIKPVKIKKQDESFNIYAKAFFQFFDIDYTAGVKVADARWSKRDGAVILTLGG